MEIVAAAAAALVATLLSTGGAALVLRRSYRRVGPGEALVLYTPREPRVKFVGALVFPVLHRAETVDLTLKVLRLQRRGEDALATGSGAEDKVEVDLVAHLRVNPVIEDILKVASRIGCASSYEPRAVFDLFTPRVEAALASVIGEVSGDELLEKRTEIEERIAREIGRELDGFVLDRLVLERVERLR